MNKRIIVIGDVHGCVDTLRNLITKIQPTSKDKIIMLGDYFDRGPSSAEVFKYLKVMDSVWNCTFLKGNHEQLMIDAFWKGNKYLWYSNGGQITEKDFIKNEIQIGEVIAWASKLPLWAESEKFYFVHAGLPYGNPDENEACDMIWSRDHITARINAADKLVIFGHTPQPAPLETPCGNFCIDTGCVYNYEDYQGKLTAMIINAENEDEYYFYSVMNIDF